MAKSSLPILVLRSIFTVLWFLVLLATWVVAWVLQVVVRVAMYPFSTLTQRQDVCGHIFRVCNMITMDYCNPLWWTTVRKPLDVKSLPEGRPVIFMFNHLSNSDPWTCVRILRPLDAKWICKGSLFSVPFGGWCLANCGDLAVHFTKEKGGWGTAPGSVRKLMEQSAELLRRRQPIAVFPEGNRSKHPDGPLQEFKAGFFDLAIREKAVIVPIALSGTQNMWPRGQWQFGAARAYASVGPYVESNGKTLDELIAAVRASIDNMREEHPDRIAKRKLEGKTN